MKLKVLHSVIPTSSVLQINTYLHTPLPSKAHLSSRSCFLSLRVHYILNVTREIDNFFPGVFEYHNIRVYDEEATDLLAYWNDTYKFISRAK